MSSLSKSSLVTVTRDDYFSEIIEVYGTNVNSVICNFLGNAEKKLKVETSNTIIRIYGNYTNQYKDQIIYVEKGQSANLDLGLSYLQQQKLISVVTSTSDVPPGKDLLQFTQDVDNQYLTVKYKVFVTDASGVSEFDIEQRINNDFSFGTNFLKSYFPSIPGEVPPKFKVIDYVIYESGKNYFVGNTFTVPGGTGNSAIISVSSVNANGNVLNISIDYSGSYSESPTITYQYHSNTGSNLVIGLVMGVE